MSERERANNKGGQTWHVYIRGRCWRLARGAGSARSQSDVDVAAVMAASSGYDAAVSTLDAAATEKVWAHEAYVDNVGPQHKAMQFGWDANQDAFRSGTIANSAQLTVRPIDPRVHINGDVGWVVGQAAGGTLKNGTRIVGSNFAMSILERFVGHPGVTPAQEVAAEQFDGHGGTLISVTNNFPFRGFPMT